MKIPLLTLTLILALTSTVWASCITTWDPGLRRYLTRCSDGRRLITRYDEGLQYWRTEERPTKQPRPKAQPHHRGHSQ